MIEGCVCFIVVYQAREILHDLIVSYSARLFPRIKDSRMSYLYIHPTVFMTTSQGLWEGRQLVLESAQDPTCFGK